MGATEYQQTSFLGGEISQAAQGRIDLPTYRASLNVCLNTIPTEQGAALRRPGTGHCALTRGGAPGRVLAFDFNQPFPYMMEFTDGFVRFFNEKVLAKTNDDQAVVSISGANPAVVATLTAHGWATGNSVMLATDVTRLQNRVLLITVASPTTFSIADAITGAAIDGATLNAFTSGTVGRVHEVASPYTGGTWANVRSIQAETTAVLLNGTAPQVMTVTAQPSDVQFANFALNPATFLDGPYLDPIKGSTFTSSLLSGIVTLTLSFTAYDAAVAYNIGDYVVSAGVSYRSLTAANQGHTPASSPANWLVVNAGDPLNNGAGFIPADIGRLIRLFSEPPLWVSSTVYATAQAVAYPGPNGASQYWVATVNPVPAGTRPGTSTAWAIDPTLAVWTWGRILSISTSGAITPGTPFGTLTQGGGLAAAFDGNTSHAFAAAAGDTASTATQPQWQPFTYYPPLSVVQYQGTVYEKGGATTGGVNEYLPPPGNPLWGPTGTLSSIIMTEYIGLHYGSPKIVSTVTVYPTTDIGFANGALVTFNLRGKSTAPASASDGTLLGSTPPIGTTFSPITITSTDQTTAWNYVWLELIAGFYQPLFDDGSHVFTAKIGIAQATVYSPNIANGSVITAQIVGPALLHAVPIRTWRLGVYGGTNGWPKCGTYQDARLWISGVVGNRADSSKTLNPDAIAKGIFDFAPTATTGVVADDNAISVIFAAKDVNTIFWMEPDQQGILCGTQAGEWLISPAGPGAMSPTNISAKRVTKIGCADIEPRRTDHTLVFVQKFRRKIMEYFADVYSGKFSAPNLSKPAKHMTVPGIKEIAYQQELAPIVWARLDNGVWCGTLYQRDSLTTSKGPDINGWHRHALGSLRQVRSIAVGASSDGNLDSLYMVTEDPAGGTFHVEILTNMLDEGFALTSAWMLDDALVPTSFSIDETPITGAPYGGVTLNGLWPHNGKTVSAFLIGLDCGATTGTDGRPTIQDFTVTNGSIFVPFGDGVSGGSGNGLFTAALARTYLNTGLALPMVVGFTYTSDGQIVRAATPQETALPHPALGDTRRTHMFAAQLYGAVTGTISFGTEFTNMKPAKFKNKAGTEYSVQRLFGGVHQGPIEADSDFDNMVCWRMTRPNATAFVIALGAALHVQGR